MANSTADYHLADAARLTRFVTDALVAVGTREPDAAVVAEVLVAADMRGVESHGVARLQAYYIARIQSGVMLADAPVTVVRETPTSLVLDAANGLGHPASKRAMAAVIAKAKVSGCAFAAVRNSNHYGIAGYYAMLALDHDLIGMSSTNSIRYGAATAGRGAMLGTNPWAYAIPAAREPAFVLDFATTTVARGKLEVAERKGVPLPPGWAIDADGAETLDPATGLRGSLLPLGGFGTSNGGHKGYGLGLLADLMCATLAGGPGGTDLPTLYDPPRAGAISHFFGVIDPAGFADVATYKAAVDRELRQFKDSERAEPGERIYVAGEIEHERTVAARSGGVPIHHRVWDGLATLASDLHLPFTIAR